MSASILSSVDECRLSCCHSGDWTDRIGDVRRCVHGYVLYCYDRFDGRTNWERLTPFWDPIRYARAIRALRIAADEEATE